ncbi:MAG: phosphatase [Actinomycetota bacterium]|nr:phosphatase [Actinomycetota bacterium]MDI6821490.1 phosphatase [Actinomycetota bacterium]
MKLVADLHIHTVASGHAYSTIDEIAKAAALKGLKLIAITDHGPGLPGGAHAYHFWNLRVVPRELYGVRILKGVEANIVDSGGNLDLPQDLLKTLDIVHVGFHPRCGYEGKTTRENTRALLGAIRNPFVDVIVHPGNPNFPIDAEEVVAAAAAHDALFEINNSSFLTSTSRVGSYAYDLEIAKVARRHNLDIIISSDAHLAQGVGEFGEAIKLALEAGYLKENILNCSLDKVLNFVERKKEIKFAVRT